MRRCNSLELLHAPASENVSTNGGKPQDRKGRMSNFQGMLGKSLGNINLDDVSDSDDDDDEDSVENFTHADLAQFPQGGLRYLPKSLIDTYKMHRHDDDDDEKQQQQQQQQHDLRRISTPTTKIEFGHHRHRPKNNRTHKLPHHRSVRGTVLILDMSGFTALGERLRSELGPMDGAAEFALKVNGILSAMVRQVDKHGGQVILFAGDALVCLFEERKCLEQSDSGGGTKATLESVRRCCLNVLGEVATTSEGNFTVHGGAAHGLVHCFYIGRHSGDPGDCKFLMSGNPLTLVGDLLDEAGKGEMRIDGLGDFGFLTEDEGMEVYLKNRSCEDSVSMERASFPPIELSTDNIDFRDVHPYARAYISKLQARRSDNDAQNSLSLLDNELRPVAVIFVGLKDFDNIDPDEDEKTLQIMNECFISLSSITDTCNGAVQNMLMDDKGCVFISVFGATSSELNSCFDATMCAMRMQKALMDLQLKRFSLGVSYGDCFCGEFGPPSRSDFFVMGAEVNMAARLKGKAPNHGILVSEHVYNNAKEDILFNETSEKIKVKGKKDPFYAYIPVSRQRKSRKMKSNIEIDAVKGENQSFIAMPSRQVQMNTMVKTIEDAKNGSPSVVFISSAPFLGKSRVIQEATNVALSQGFTPLNSFRTSLDSYTSFFPFQEITSTALQACAMRLLNEEFSDDLSAMSELIDAKVLNKSDRVVIGSILPTVVDAQLISLLKGQNPASLAKSIVNSLFKILKPLQPLVLTLEGDGDLDPSSWNLLSGLMKQAPVDCPQLTIYVAFRDNPIIPLAASNLRTDGKHVTLTPFDENETEVFVKGYLGIDDQTIRIGKQLLDVVYDRSNGCPTFMEYIVRWALDKNMFEYADGGRTLGLKMIDDTDVTTAIPRELSNIVLAAFNNLSPVLWDALKIASCVGYSFNIAVYGELTGLDFLPRIKELSKNHDAFERCSGNRYKWKHQAVFEAVKSLLMTNQRKELHNMIVKAFEERTSYFSNAGNLRDEVHRILARHCGMAELWEGAYTQYMQAGKYAEDTHKFSDAARMYEEAIAVQARIAKESLSARIDDKLLPKVRLGNCFRESARYEEAEKLLTECVAEAERNMADGSSGEKVYVGALTSLAVLYQARSKYSQAKELYCKALPISREIQKSPSSLWLAGIIAGYAETLRKSGDLPLAEKLHREALTMRNIAAKENRCTELELAISYTQLGCTQAGLGHFDEAYEQHRSALLSRFKYLDFSHALVSESLNYCAESLCALDRPTEGIPLALHAVDIRKAVFGSSHPALAHALSVLASNYHKAGRSNDALGFLEQCLEICEKFFSKEHANLIPNLMNYGEVLRATGNCMKAKEVYENAAKIHAHNFKEGQRAGQLKKCQLEIEELTVLIEDGEADASEMPRSLSDTDFSKLASVDVETTGTPIIVLTDIGRDTDDELAMVLLAALKRKCLLNPIAVVTTLSPQRERAWLTRGSLDALGMLDVPVGIGSAGGVNDGERLEFYGGNYARESYGIFEDGMDLMVRGLKASPPNSVQLLCIASLSDAATLLRENEQLFLEKIKEVVVMGGLQPLETTDFIQPDTAYNNHCDMPSAQFVYRRCQELGIPTVTISRWAAYGSAVSTVTLLDTLASTEHMVASNIREVSEANILNLWKKVNYPPGDPRRERLPERCDRKWFCQTFMDKDDVDETHDVSIWSQIKKFNMYDPLAVLNCIPAFRKEHFIGKTKVVNGTSHMLVGVSKDDTGIINVEALQVEFTTLLKRSLMSSLLFC